MGRVAGLTAEDTRHRLVDAAAEVFAEHGYDGARTSDIARRAGLSTGAIYSQYGTKAELLVEAIRAHAPAEIDRLFAHDDTALLDVISRLAHRPASRHRRGTTLLVEAATAARRDPEVNDVLAAAAADRERDLAARIAAAQARGDLDDTIAADALARFLLTFALGAVVVEALALPAPKRSGWSALIGRFLGGIRPPARRRPR